MAMCDGNNNVHIIRIMFTTVVLTTLSKNHYFKTLSERENFIHRYLLESVDFSIFQ